MMYFLLFIVSLYIIILIHELGHFVSAKLFGLKVDDFSIGFGKAICKYEGTKTSFNLRAIPLGGYVHIEDRLEKLPLMQKIIVSLSGVFFNAIVGILVIAYTLKVGLWKATERFFYIANVLIVEVLGNFKLSDYYSPEGSITNVVTNGTMALQEVGFPIFIIVMSIVMVIFNLIPIPPTDGAKVLEDVIKNLTKRANINSSITKKIKVVFYAAGTIFLVSPVIVNTLWSSGRNLGLNFLQTMLLFIAFLLIAFVMQNKSLKKAR